MRVSIKTPTGSDLLEVKNQQKRLNSPLSLMEIEVEPNEHCDIQISKSKQLCQQGKNTYRIVSNAKNHCGVQIKYNETLSNIQFDYVGANLIEEKTVENLMHFQNSLKSLNMVEDRKWTMQTLFKAIESGEITLFSVTKPLTGFDNKSLLDRLESALSQKVRAICSSPKQGIRTDELVQDVSMVKRINTNTLTHLSSHTEHWKTRTLSGLIPKRLKADIIEDEINIYENLFFKMAIDDIADYTSSQIRSLKIAKSKNDKAIDWEEYGMKINDYNRSILLQKLMPGKDTTALNNENKTYTDALERWLKVIKILVSIRSSTFYQKIDRKKRISKTVHLTNILKNDQRYKALYDIWCLVRKENQKEKQGITNDITNSVEQYYYTYTALSFMYSMHLQGINFEENASYELDESEQLTVNATAKDDNFLYDVYSEKNEFGHSNIVLKISERVKVPFQLVVDWKFDDELLHSLRDIISVDYKKKEVILHKRPSSQERTQIRELVHIRQSELKRKSKEEQEHYKRCNTAWIKFVDELPNCQDLHNPSTRQLTIYPLFYSVLSETSAINKLANELFHKTEGYLCYFMPNSMELYNDIQNASVIRKIFNYGEAFAVDDDESWKDYKVATLPVIQTDIGSIQRMMKYISLHRTKLIMEIEENNPKKCPICVSTQITNIGTNTWKCNNSDCGIEWGKTRCTKGCKDYFHWIKPDGSFEKKDFKYSSVCDFIMQKDSLFDRYIITDFEFELTDDGRLKPYPVCPKCGARRNKSDTF